MYQMYRKIVTTILRKWYRADKSDELDDTALMKVAQEGQSEIVKDLIEAGADFNKATNDGETALMQAASRGHTEIVKLFLAFGADVNRADQIGMTALIKVAWQGHTEMVKALLDAGADVNKANQGGDTALMRAAQEGHTETIKALIVAGADVNKVDICGTTALIEAAWQGHTEIVKALIAAGADVNQVNNNGKTALMIATQRGDGEIITAIKDFKTAYPTIIAIQENRMSAWAVTEEHAREKTEAGYTILMAACARNDLALAQNLLKYGADIYAQDTYGRTALSCAHSTTMVMDCIKNHTLDIPAALGSIHSAHTILERAVQQDNRDLVELILRNVPKLVESSSNVLSLSNDIAVIRLLLKHGIRPPSNSVLQPHIQQEVMVYQILASTPWSYAQRLTMSVGDVKAWMRDYADMLPKETDYASRDYKKTMKEKHKWKDDTKKATKFWKKDDPLLYTVYCAKVVREMKEHEMSSDTKILVNLIESKMYLENRYIDQALDRLLDTPEVIDVHAASYRIKLEESLQPLLMTRYESSHDERLLEFLRRFMHDHITIAPKESEDYQVLLALTDEITAGASDDVDKSIKELITKAEAFGDNKEHEEGVFGDCLVEWTKNCSMNNHVVSSNLSMFSVSTVKDSTLQIFDKNGQNDTDRENNFSLVS